MFIQEVPKFGGRHFRAGVSIAGAFFLVLLCVASIFKLSSRSRMTAEAPAIVSSFQMAGKRMRHIPSF